MLLNLVGLGLFLLLLLVWLAAMMGLAYCIGVLARVMAFGGAAG